MNNLDFKHKNKYNSFNAEHFIGFFFMFATIFEIISFLNI